MKVRQILINSRALEAVGESEVGCASEEKALCGLQGIWKLEVDSAE